MSEQQFAEEFKLEAVCQVVEPGYTIAFSRLNAKIRWRGLVSMVLPRGFEPLLPA